MQPVDPVKRTKKIPFAVAWKRKKNEICRIRLALKVRKTEDLLFTLYIFVLFIQMKLASIISLPLRTLLWRRKRREFFSSVHYPKTDEYPYAEH